jgi:hypothetical protein
MYDLCHKWPRICSVCRNRNQVLSPFMTYHRVCNKSYTTCATHGTGTAYPSRANEFTSGILVGFVLLDLSFLCDVLQLVVCPFVIFLLALCYLSFDLQLLVSSNIFLTIKLFHIIVIDVFEMNYYQKYIGWSRDIEITWHRY